MASHTPIRIVALGRIVVGAGVGGYLLNKALHKKLLPAN